MTNTERIKAEIAHQIEVWRVYCCTDGMDYNREPAVIELRKLLAFIDTLEKEKSEIPTTPALVWKRIKRGERLPCRAYLYNIAYEQKGNFHGVATVDGFLVPNEPVRVGCDTWYLPADAVKNLPKEGQI